MLEFFNNFMVKNAFKLKKAKSNEVVNRLKEKLEIYLRVLRIARKPERDEIKLLLRITVVGLSLVCIFAFLIKTIIYLIGGL